MRPVRLSMAGFAAFREPAVVDFSDTEYFVLVGPTGAGKSTVIDAITFALYGSVPRWDDERAVALALAPTVGRGTVSLVFDLGAERYVVARELRRSGSTGTVTVKGARLERLADPAGTAGADEATEPLADGAREVTRRVEELLGLPFDDFCTCVVLPQGDFAEFLHAKAGDRQKKLERILGMGIYERIMRRANTESAAAQERAGVLEQQLDDPRYADATPEAERAAAARVTGLEALAGRVATAAPRIAAATDTRTGAEQHAARLREERTRLAALTAPAGLDELDARRRAAAGTRDRARAAVAATEDADTAARRRRDDGPDRGRLEQVRRDHAGLARIEDELPGLQVTAETARAGFAAAAERGTTTAAAVDAARAAATGAAAEHGAATEDLERAERERDALRAVTAPAGLAEVDDRYRAARRALDRARAGTADAEAAETAAREAVATGPEREPLEQARRDHRALAEARARREAAEQRRQDADRAAASAREHLAAARADLAAARDRQSGAERADLAAALRPTLHAGAHCPVCAQPVATLPDPLPTGGAAAAARAARDAAEAGADASAEAARTAGAAAEVARGEVERDTAEIVRLEAALAGFGGPADVDDRLAGLDRAARALETAGREARETRQLRDRAVATADGAREALTAARDALRAARDPLVRLGIEVPELGAARPGPDPDSDGPDGTAGAVAREDVAAAGEAFLAWARAAAAERDTAAAQARGRVGSATRERDATADALADAERAAGTARRAETAAARAEQEAAAAVRAARNRATELRAGLVGAPTDADAEAGLHRIDELDREAREAGAALLAARAALRTAEQDAADLEREVAVAWQGLRRSRDPLVELGAPLPEGDDPAAAWAELVGWAGAEAAARESALPAADGDVDRARSALDALVADLARELDRHGVPVPGTDPALAATEVAGAVQAARGERDRIAERRAEAAGLAQRRDRAREEQQVAAVLGRQLRSDGFPRWLVASALDALVVDASEKLGELSGGQFSLTHDRGEFLVVDHTDADSRRPVKTLSGGETFQASLSLALALSAQLSGLAARGAPRLESIVLDEGFGTLDESNLDVVASTLENLAVTGDRMVGVITHVPALAERIPVRYTVHRDQRGSRVVREGA